MLTAVQGVYRRGQVHLAETPAGIDEADVVVTFMPRNGAIDLRARGIDAAQAAELRARLMASAEDWDRPEMAVYDEL